MLSHPRQAIIHRRVDFRALGTDKPRREFLDEEVELQCFCSHPGAYANVAEISTTVAGIMVLVGLDIGHFAMPFHVNHTSRKANKLQSNKLGRCARLVSRVAPRLL
jgi:hypothetical protein